jgi:phosphatidylserine/phosphatidylglycerophosphate/cardiolipin synthase-like enzyme
VLVCDASNHAISSGQTDATVLRRAFERGVELNSLQDLHAKLVLFGKTAIIGSANLSESALAEEVLITTDHVIHAAVASLIDEMVRRAVPIDVRFLDRISKIIVKRSPRSCTCRWPKVSIRRTEAREHG